MIKAGSSQRRELVGMGLAGLIGFGCRAPLDPVVIRFQGVDVRRSAFLKDLEPLARNGTDTSDPEMRASAFGKFIEEKVVALAAMRSGFKDAEANRAEAERWLTAALPKDSVSEAEARAYYDAHPGVAAVEDSVTIREILLTTQQDARDVVRILRSDRNAFELLARTRSHSPQASGGGLLGSFRRGELPPEIEHVAFSLSPGQISGIAITAFGYHVLRLEAKTSAATRSFAESRPEIESRLAESKARLRMKQFIDGLVSQAQVNYEAVMAR
ncbi:MAG: peptidylprolyl isomerase [Vicinamibacteria bacterium]|nr:peptidylprolyl isomerase [Vicinamibacteria bacterium]